MVLAKPVLATISARVVSMRSHRIYWALTLDIGSVGCCIEAEVLWAAELGTSGKVYERRLTFTQLESPVRPAARR